MKTMLPLLFSCGLLFVNAGCATGEQSAENAPARPKASSRAASDEGDVRALAAYYMKSGAAKDMGQAIQMAKDFYWADVEDEYSLLGKQEAKLEAIRKEAEANRKE